MYELRVDMTDFEGESRFAKYKLFQVGSRDTKFRLTVGGYSGTAGTYSTSRDTKNDRMNLVTCWTICYKYAAKSSPHIQCLYMDRLDFKFQIRTCSLWNIILWGHTPLFIKQKIDWNLNLRQPIQYKFTNIFSSWVYCRYLKSSLYCQFSPICKVPNTGGLGYLSFIRST